MEGGVFDVVCRSFLLRLFFFFRGVFYPFLRRLALQQLWLCRAEKIGNVLVGIVTCVSCIVGVVRVHVAAVLCLAW
jgi:hypothetical protein